LVEESVVLTVRRYLHNLRQRGIPVAFGVVFGSQSRGEAGRWSDFDLLVVSPHFDRACQRSDVSLLWKVAARTDSRIEPIPVDTNSTSPMIPALH
jgi:predicted nucleotidyltransferase